jgi:hypothetical protein
MILLNGDLILLLFQNIMKMRDVEITSVTLDQAAKMRQIESMRDTVQEQVEALMRRAIISNTVTIQTTTTARTINSNNISRPCAERIRKHTSGTRTIIAE